eukprot:scaffold5688_cov116-Isochrysis_galbana.AAC.9
MGRCFESVDCWASLCVELKGRSTIVQSAKQKRTSSTDKLLNPPSSASQVKAHPSWPQTTSLALARGDPTSPSCMAPARQAHVGTPAKRQRGTTNGPSVHPARHQD